MSPIGFVLSNLMGELLLLFVGIFGRQKTIVFLPTILYCLLSVPLSLDRIVYSLTAKINISFPTSQINWKVCLKIFLKILSTSFPKKHHSQCYNSFWKYLFSIYFTKIQSLFVILVVSLRSLSSTGSSWLSLSLWRARLRSSTTIVWRRTWTWTWWKSWHSQTDWRNCEHLFREIG